MAPSSLGFVANYRGKELAKPVMTSFLSIVTFKGSLGLTEVINSRVDHGFIQELLFLWTANWKI